MANVSENESRAHIGPRSVNARVRGGVQPADNPDGGSAEKGKYHHGSTSAKELDFRGVYKTYSSARNQTEFTAIEDVSLKINAGEFVSIVGPSGCGKSTLLSLMAGLNSPSKGEVAVDGQRVSGIRQDVGYVLQQDSLLPWRTVLDQVGLALRYRGVDKRERTARARDWIDRVGLGEFENLYPHQLSGGMRKRVAIAAALVYDPDVILMDEPFGALDSQTRLILQNDLVGLWQDGGHQTVIFVTHDLEEAIGLSDRVVLMSAGPGRLIGDYQVSLSRPRNLLEIKLDPVFLELYQQIWSGLRGEVLKSGAMSGRAKYST
jgi:NitT/TauT family transport system ATP-binding protein